MTLTTLARSFGALLLVLAVSSPDAGAQITLSGSVFDGNGGPLVSGQTYQVTGTITVPAGETLTIQPDVTVLFDPLRQLVANGTLLAQGTASDPILMTSSQGGTSAPGDWRGLSFSGTAAASVLEHVEIAFTGNFGLAGIELSAGADITVDQCTIRDGSSSAVSLNNAAVAPSISNCAFLDNAGVAVDELRLQSVPGFSGNVASGNGQDTMRVTSQAQIDQDVAISADDLLDGVLLITVTQTIPAARTLTLGPGVVIKMPNTRQIIAAGTLVTNGAPGDEVVFTSVFDDANGGDTGGDGPTTGQPGDWRGLRFDSTSGASNLSHSVIAYGGDFGLGGIELAAGADITVDHCTIRDGAAAGVDFNGAATTPIFSNCAFLDNAGAAVDQLRLQSVAGFSGNVASGNGQDTMRVTSQVQIDQDVSISADALLDGVLLVTVTQTIPTGRTLTLGQGVVFKLSPTRQIIVDGTLVANGVPGDEVVFTSDRDDTIGGDTAGDGPTTAQPGDWRGLRFDTTAAASSIAHTVIAFSGDFSQAGIELSAGADITVDGCTIRDGSTAGIDFNDVDAAPTITGCAFVDNGGAAVDQMRLESVPGFSGNVASGNGQDVMRVTSQAQLTQDITITTDDLLGGVLLFTSAQTIPSGTTLTIGEGVTFKFTSQRQLIVDGGLVTLGTAQHRVVLTADTDDEVGGDTNGDGTTTSPSPGHWRGVRLDAGPTPDSLAYTTIRYSGDFSTPALESDDPAAELDALRAEYCSARGFDVSVLAGALEDSVAFSCGDDGFLLGSDVDAINCSSVDNGGDGFTSSGVYTGEVRSSVAWDNGGAPFGNIPVTQVFFSNGEAAFTGTNANRFVPPLFSDQAGGDLTLLPGSLMIDFGEFAPTPSGMGAGGFTRNLDGLLDGVRRKDIGAYEFSNLELAVLGAPVAGGSITVSLDGTPGLQNTTLFAGLSTFEASFKRFGNLFVDITGLSATLALPDAPSNTPLPLPAELPPGFEIYLQAIALNGPSPATAAGNLSQLVKITIE